MLISKPKDKDIRGGRVRNICLIPELCRTTGISQTMRINSPIMQQLSAYTRTSPRERVDKLISFIRRLKTTQESKKIFENANMELSNEV